MGRYLERINFVNNKAPWLNDINLNKLQENIENVITELHSQGVATGDTLPVGSVLEWYSDTIPENWLLCEGQEVSRNDFQELFSVLDTKYGEGNGSTTFNLPNLKGKGVIGKDKNDTDFNELGKTGGEKKHTLIKTEMPQHQHKMTLADYGSDNASGVIWKSGNTAGKYKYSGDMVEPVGGSQPHNNLQPYIICNFIIKAKQSSGLVATVIDNLESTSATDALSAKQGKKILELVFPIGSTYITQTNSNPSTILGFGTWERLKGKICLGVEEEDSTLNEIGKTGGEKEHTLTIAEIPSHSHSQRLEWTNGTGWGLSSATVGDTNVRVDGNVNTGSIGEGQAHNNMQPYEVVRIYVD